MKFAIFICFIWLTIMFVMIFNPGGYGQRICWGMQPPYHWEQTGNSISEEHYVGVNGNICATVYNLNVSNEQSDTWRFYGLGFSGTLTKDLAEKKAERECK